jgi:hypothetical protein
MMVFVNGVMQLQGIDYKSTRTQLSFSTPPHANSIIEMKTVDGGSSYINADGKRYVFDLTEQFAKAQRLSDALAYAYQNKDNPTIADALERLLVVVELMKDETRQV